MNSLVYVCTYEVVVYFCVCVWGGEEGAGDDREKNVLGILKNWYYYWFEKSVS